MFSTEASLNPDEYTAAQSQLSPFTQRCPRGLPIWEGTHWQLIGDETPPQVPAADFKDEEEDLPKAGLAKPMWDEEPVLDNREYLCIH